MRCGRVRPHSDAQLSRGRSSPGLGTTPCGEAGGEDGAGARRRATRPDAETVRMAQLVRAEGWSLRRPPSLLSLFSPVSHVEARVLGTWDTPNSHNLGDGVVRNRSS